MSAADAATQAFVRRAAEGLLRGAGLPLDAVPGGWPVDLTARVPPFDTRHFIVEATAAALAAQAQAVEMRWRLAEGAPQHLGIDLVQAAAALFPSRYQRQSGHAVPIAIGAGLKQDFYRTADARWFYPVGSYPWFQNATLDLLECPNNTEAIARSMQRRTALEWEDAFAAHRLTGAFVRTPAEWASHPQGRALAARPAVSLRKIGEAAPLRPAAGLPRPLADVRVLDLSHVIAGPIAARTLAEQGASVLRVGAPHQADPLLQIMDTGIGKRSAFLDLREAPARERLRELAATTDVVVESWRPGGLAGKGFAPADAAAIRPGVVYVSVSAYGDVGPWAERGGYEQVGQVATGVCHTEGGAGPPRLVPTHFLNDYLTGYLAAAGAAAALVRRALEGGSWHVTVSLAATSMWVQSLGTRDAPALTIHPSALEPRLEARDSPFGRLEQLPPVATFSLTPSRWELPPAPLGAHPPRWI